MVSKWVVTPIYRTYRLVEVPPGCGKLGCAGTEVDGSMVIGSVG